MAPSSRGNRAHCLQAIEILGVRLSLECPNQILLQESLHSIRRFFPSGTRLLGRRKTGHHFTFAKRNGTFKLNSEFGAQDLGADQSHFLKHIRSLARIIVASNARDLLFIHAGVVVVNGKGIIFPGDSHSGKTSIVKELVKRGAIYFSDEYAVLDAHGMLHPFAKPLSVRGLLGPEIQTEVDVGSLGGSVGKEPVQIAHVVFAKYRKGACWRPKRIPIGEGLLELVPHVIGFAKRPHFALPILEKSLKNAIISESERGDVKALSKNFLETLDK